MEGAVAREAGVVDEDVEPAELPLGDRDHRVGRLRVGDRPDRDGGPGSESATERGHVLVDVVDDHGRAVAREPARDRLADPAPGPGDERDASVERTGHQ